jgi:transposase
VPPDRSAQSEASLLTFVLQLHRALAAWEQEAVQQLLAQPSLHGDEMALRADRKNQWVHPYCGGEITLRLLHRNRGSETTDSINITPRYGGTLIHDGLVVYFS